MKNQVRGPPARAHMSASGTAAAAAGGTGAGSEPGAGSGAGTGSGAATGAGTMPSKSAEWLQEELEARGGASLLLLDCRPHELFESSHIETAINLAIPGLMLRRLRKGNLPIRSIIPNHADKERFATRCKAATVLLYDEATAEWQPEPGAPASVLGLLLQKLRDDGCQAYYLQGEAARARPGWGSPRPPGAPAGAALLSPRSACPRAPRRPRPAPPLPEPGPEGSAWGVCVGGGIGAPLHPSLGPIPEDGANFPPLGFPFNCCWRPAAPNFQRSPRRREGPVLGPAKARGTGFRSSGRNACPWKARVTTGAPGRRDEGTEPPRIAGCWGSRLGGPWGRGCEQRSSPGLSLRAPRPGCAPELAEEGEHWGGGARVAAAGVSN